MVKITFRSASFRWYSVVLLILLQKRNFFFLTYGEVAFVRSVVLARRDFEELLVVASKIVMALHHCISSSEDA